ncbi:LysR family transcriptional regulator [Xanthomonas sp. NCPPB 2654]|uniref:LysR family transcriptional regulator n=1 Tax=unclassified Xanthomonas TaxID=2643310 RepID=UPI0021E0A8F1|nr:MULTISPECIES: LysR family transcriptional regulator [unclassified Xanthomonas]MDL5367681.1 LysR family transcriptional regulator [Xanthomonas sp. NCPPB 2654]UYC21358.1 LysR family transcriptional regulator [Xanthomonas sp. CFBP 8443]
MAASPLPAVVAFARVAHHASFTRAANELGVSASALSQTVRALEAQLGVRLLHRTTRRVALSEHGARFLERVRPGLAQIEAAFLDLDMVRERPAGRLRITLPRVVADQLVMPWLPAFLARYPQIEVELCVDAALVDVVAEGFDAGIRLGECLARDMIAVPLGPMQRQVIVAAPSYFRRHPLPQTPADLVDHDCIVHRMSNGRRMAWEFTRDGRDFEVEVSGTLVFNDSGLTHAAALAGLGLAQGFESVVAADVAAGRLVRVLDDWQQPFAGFYLYYPAREHLAPKLRVFIDHLRAANASAG